MSDGEYEPRLRDPRIPVAAEVGGEKARGEVLPCFDCGQSDHGMHDPRCHVEQLRQGHRMQIQMLQRELQLLREKNAAVPPQHHHRYGSGATNIITIHQYGGAPPLPPTWFDNRSPPSPPAAPRVASRSGSRPPSRRSPSLPARVAISPLGSGTVGSRRRRSRGPPTGSMASPRRDGQNGSAGYSRRGPTSWTWVRDLAPVVSSVTPEASPGEVCLVKIPSGTVETNGGLAQEEVVTKVESSVGGVSMSWK